jgi:hypothetical protein
MTEGNFETPFNGAPIRFRPDNFDTLARIVLGDEKIPFYVNPSSISFAYRQKISRKKSRAGWIEEHWGEELDTLTVEAVSGGFKSESYGYGGHIATRKSGEVPAFQRLESIVQAYRDNGLSITGSFPSEFLPIQFHFDKYIYYGFFESLNLDESADRPFMMSFSFTFKVLGTDVIF